MINNTKRIPKTKTKTKYKIFTYRYRIFKCCYLHIYIHTILKKVENLVFANFELLNISSMTLPKAGGY